MISTVQQQQELRVRALELAIEWLSRKNPDQVDATVITNTAKTFEAYLQGE